MPIETISATGQARPWSMAIFAAREDVGQLMATVRSIAEAAVQPTCIDLMINGNPGLVQSAAQALEATPRPGAGHLFRVWSVALGGKAHAWNQYVHRVWPGSDAAFFADGYVLPQAQAMARVAGLLAGSTQALAGTGMPLTGGTAQVMQQRALQEGALHGNFFALKRETMQTFRATGFMLPLGLYGFDTVLGGVLGFGADPAQHAWDPRARIVSAADISWLTPEKQWWSITDVRTQFNRTLNNALRQLVRQSTKHYLARQKLPPGTLPKTIEDYVLTWAHERPDELRATLWRHPLSRLALRKLQVPRDWSKAALAPELVCERA